MEQNNQAVRRVPVRRCVGCGEHFPKKELVRVLRTPDGDTVLDLTGKMSGRGAYICRDLSCFKKARKSRRIESSLECSVSEDVYDRMEREISGG